MNANCTKCYKPTPYAATGRPKFCSHCGFSLDPSASIASFAPASPAPAKQQTSPIRPQNRYIPPKEEVEEYVDLESLEISASIQGTSSKGIKLGDIAESPSYGEKFTRPAFEGNPQEELNKLFTRRVEEIDE